MKILDFSRETRDSQCRGLNSGTPPLKGRLRSTRELTRLTGWDSTGPFRQRAPTPSSLSKPQRAPQLPEQLLCPLVLSSVSLISGPSAPPSFPPSSQPHPVVGAVSVSPTALLRAGQKLGLCTSASPCRVLTGDGPCPPLPKVAAVSPNLC